MAIGFVWEELYTQHITGQYHSESPDRLWAIKEVLEDEKNLKNLMQLVPKPASKKVIAFVHSKNYIDEIERTKGKFVALDPDTSASPATWDAACLAVGGAIACVDHTLKNNAGSFAFVRPPGHHAERSRAMGFCIFNNIAIAAEYAIREHGLKKIAILDFDVHHGNGTQHHFYDRPDVFFASTHRFPFYPGTGSAAEIGEGMGRGFTLNIPLNGGAGDDEFKTAWKMIIRRVKEFAPELILVSAGFDAHKDDPLGGMNVTTDCYRWLASELNGRAVFVLEGGYSLSALKSCTRAMLQEMF